MKAKKSECMWFRSALVNDVHVSDALKRSRIGMMMVMHRSSSVARMRLRLAPEAF